MLQVCLALTRPASHSLLAAQLRALLWRRRPLCRHGPGGEFAQWALTQTGALATCLCVRLGVAPATQQKLESLRGVLIGTCVSF